MIIVIIACSAMQLQLALLLTYIQAGTLIPNYYEVGKTKTKKENSFIMPDDIEIGLYSKRNFKSKG